MPPWKEGDFVIQSGVLCKIVSPYIHKGLEGHTFSGLGWADYVPGYYISGRDICGHNLIYDKGLTYIKEVSLQDILNCYYDCCEKPNSRQKKFLKEAILYLLRARHVTNIP